MRSFRKILVPTDFGPSSARALALALELAERAEGEITLLHVWEVPIFGYSGVVHSVTDVLAPIRAEAAAALESAVAAVRKEWPKVRGELRAGTPWREIETAITELAPDLVVMGTHGRGALAHALLGSVAEKTVRSSPVPVLTVRGAEEKPAR